jgi:hypothetical protein
MVRNTWDEEGLGYRCKENLRVQKVKKSVPASESAKKTVESQWRN